jgi:hypothetical protein
MQEKKFNSFLDFFRDFEITVLGKKIKLKYTAEDLLYLEEQDFPLSTTKELMNLLTEKPIKYGLLLVYAGIGDELREKITLKDFRKSITENELNNLGEFISTAFESLKSSLPKNKPLPPNAEKKK